MSPSCLVQSSLTPFLYPFSRVELRQATRLAHRLTRQPQRHPPNACLARQNGTVATHPATTSRDELLIGDDGRYRSRLDPTPDDYTTTPFKDSCTLTLTSGSGGNGCVSFLREKFIANGPPNGGEGGIGGNIYIQAVAGETSLHKISRRREVKAGKGKNGQGSNKNGQRGSDVLITVPVGTVVRELARHDPVKIEEDEFIEEAFAARRKMMEEKYQRLEREKEGREETEDEIRDRERKEREENPLDLLGPTRRDKFVMYPGEDPTRLFNLDLRLPQPRRSNLSGLVPEMPITLDLDKHMQTPQLLAAGAMGGFGNPSFVSKNNPSPKIATKGDGGVKIVLHLELKLLADVGLVGLPNAGKSTLLRALSNSRARVGNWAFTTLQPNIGTVVLDDHKGRSKLQHLTRKSGRTRFTIADIPGVIEDAHMDKGLGLSFLRHIERARILAFVIDLAAGDAVTALKALWTEVSEYEHLVTKGKPNADAAVLDWQPTQPSSVALPLDASEATEDLILQAKENLPPLSLAPMSTKPWFVVATKADLPETQENYLKLQHYLEAVEDGNESHPGRSQKAWRERLYALPTSGIRGEGVERIPEVVVDMLDG